MKPSKISPDLLSIIRRKTADRNTTARDFVRLAELAESEGAIATGRALRDRANGMPDAPAPSTAAYEPADDVGYQAEEDGVEAVSFVPEMQGTDKAEKGKSPITGVTPGAWKRFVKLMRTQNVSTIGPKGAIGLFGLKPRRLQDLGVLKKVRKAQGGKWQGTWVIDKKKFLSNPAAQLRVFEKSMADYANTVSTNFASALGKKVGGQTVTLSGLLAVAHVSGEPGLRSWLSSAEIRDKFPGTTKRFLDATGIF